MNASSSQPAAAPRPPATPGDPAPPGADVDPGSARSKDGDAGRSDTKDAPAAADPAPLLPRVARGDAEAVGACVDRYSGLVWSLALRMLGRGVDVEDLVQDIFVELWQKADRYDPARGKEATFVAVLTRRRAIDRLRRRGVRPDVAGPSLERVQTPPTLDDPAAPAELADELSRVESAMARLKPDQRRALRLAVCEGLTHDQTARAMDLPLGTVKTHVRRGLIRLRKLLARDAEANEGGGSVKTTGPGAAERRGGGDA